MDNLILAYLYLYEVIDLHGFSLVDANKAISNFIEECYLKGVSKINVITGKGSRSKNKNDPYQSIKLGILKYSIPEYIKNNINLMKKIKEIDYNSANNPNEGSFKHQEGDVLNLSWNSNDVRALDI